ncbi:unnamed protein product [Amoebophrya sp. A120]|nr:unnamed protein product [Amoebophrya sp. A120]|eukprot:GSA120T00008837001.1
MAASSSTVLQPGQAGETTSTTSATSAAPQGNAAVAQLVQPTTLTGGGPAFTPSAGATTIHTANTNKRDQKTADTAGGTAEGNKHNNAKKAKHGMSPEEKRQEMLAWWKSENEGGNFYTLKELENGLKPKGIRQPYLKEILEALLSEAEVLQDKVGSSTVFWLNPKKVASEKQQLRELEHLETVIEKQLVQQLQQLKTNFETVNVTATTTSSCAAGKENNSTPGVGTTALLPQKADVDRITKTNNKLKLEISQLRKKDPAELMKQRSMIPTVKEMVNKWGYHIDTCRSHLARSGGIAVADINAHFELPEEYEEVA